MNRSPEQSYASKRSKELKELLAERNKLRAALTRVLFWDVPHRMSDAADYSPEQQAYIINIARKVLGDDYDPDDIKYQK